MTNALTSATCPMFEECPRGPEPVADGVGVFATFYLALKSKDECRGACTAPSATFSSTGPTRNAPPASTADSTSAIPRTHVAPSPASSPVESASSGGGHKVEGVANVLKLGLDLNKRRSFAYILRS